MRTIRRALPRRLIDQLLARGIFIKPSWDTSEPVRRAKLYAERAAANGVDLAGKTVCVVGYGGSAAIGVALGELGAARVILQDPFAPRRQPATRLPASISADHRHIDVIAAEAGPFADVVFSNSVLEHVEDLGATVSACRAATRAGGLNVHFVDLRDHYFAYPFEMLCYSEKTWRRWLNAENNLNRLRIDAYERAFAASFSKIAISITESLVDEFRRVKHRIRPEFLSGDESRDAASMIRVEATV